MIIYAKQRKSLSFAIAFCFCRGFLDDIVLDSATLVFGSAAMGHCRAGVHAIRSASRLLQVHLGWSHGSGWSQATHKPPTRHPQATHKPPTRCCRRQPCRRGAGARRGASTAGRRRGCCECAVVFELIFVFFYQLRGGRGGRGCRSGGGCRPMADHHRWCECQGGGALRRSSISSPHFDVQTPSTLS